MQVNSEIDLGGLEPRCCHSYVLSLEYFRRCAIKAAQVDAPRVPLPLVLRLEMVGQQLPSNPLS